MKCFKIEDNKGAYSIDGEKWLSIDKINKTDLLKLLDIALNFEFEMDIYEKDKLSNQAHQIIYSNIYEKFRDILDNKNRFKDESEIMYKNAIDKYS